MSEDKKDSPSQSVSEISFKEFFEALAPGNDAQVKDLLKRGLRSRGGAIYPDLNLPSLNLYCDTCKGVRFFSPVGEHGWTERPTQGYFVAFECRNCETDSKTYAFTVTGSRPTFDENQIAPGTAHKFGELPAFGPRTPARVISLLGSEKDYYLKGRRAENQGLGIAAFAYYRRVVEKRKDKILDEIIRVSTKIGAPPDMIADLSAAKNETQFSKAVDTLRHGIPQTLLVNGHNPLTLLHSALSEGLHAQTDEECLVLAKSIRVVLTDLVERMANALKDDAELNAALSRLFKPQK